MATPKINLLIKALFGLLLAPVDAFWGLLKGAYYFFEALIERKSPAAYFWAGLENSNALLPGDKRAKVLSATFGLARLATVAATVLCILGFLGALAAPIPGVAPLYVATVAGVFKAIGITISWSVVARTVAAEIGLFIDWAFKIGPAKKGEIISTTDAKLSQQIEAKLNIPQFASSALVLGLLGEQGLDAKIKYRKQIEYNEQLYRDIEAQDHSDNSSPDRARANSSASGSDGNSSPEDPTPPQPADLKRGTSQPIGSSGVLATPRSRSESNSTNDEGDLQAGLEGEDSDLGITPGSLSLP